MVMSSLVCVQEASQNLYIRWDFHLLKKAPCGKGWQMKHKWKLCEARSGLNLKHMKKAPCTWLGFATEVSLAIWGLTHHRGKCRYIFQRRKKTHTQAAKARSHWPRTWAGWNKGCVSLQVESFMLNQVSCWQVSWLPSQASSMIYSWQHPAHNRHAVNAKESRRPLLRYPGGSNTRVRYWI